MDEENLEVEIGSAEEEADFKKFKEVLCIFCENVSIKPILRDIKNLAEDHIELIERYTHITPSRKILALINELLLKEGL